MQDPRTSKENAGPCIWNPRGFYKTRVRGVRTRVCRVTFDPSPLPPWPWRWCASSLSHPVPLHPAPLPREKPVLQSGGGRLQEPSRASAAVRETSPRLADFFKTGSKSAGGDEKRSERPGEEWEKSERGGMRALLHWRRSFWLCGVVQVGMCWKRAWKLGGARRLALIVHGVSLLFTEEVWISGSLSANTKNWVAPRG